MKLATIQCTLLQRSHVFALIIIRDYSSTFCWLIYHMEVTQTASGSRERYRMNLLYQSVWVLIDETEYMWIYEEQESKLHYTITPLFSRRNQSYTAPHSRDRKSMNLWYQFLEFWSMRSKCLWIYGLTVQDLGKKLHTLFNKNPFSLISDFHKISNVNYEIHFESILEKDCCGLNDLNIFCEMIDRTHQFYRCLWTTYNWKIRVTSQCLILYRLFMMLHAASHQYSDNINTMSQYTGGSVSGWGIPGFGMNHIKT